MSDIVEEYTVGRCTIKIEYDQDAESPRENDNIGTMVCWNRRHNLGDEQPKEAAGDYLTKLAAGVSKSFAKFSESLDGRYAGADNATWERLRERFVKERDAALEKHFVRLPLYLYDHSGITISTGSFSCPWDSGQVGFIYVSLEKARKAHMCPKSAGWDYLIDEWLDGDTYIGEAQRKLPKAQRKKITLRDAIIRGLESEVETYDDFITGACYGYVVEAENGEEESCWGFIGDLDYVKKTAEEEAARLNKQQDEEDALVVLIEAEKQVAEVWP